MERDVQDSTPPALHLKVEMPRTKFLGSILAVTISDPHTMGKTNRFVGICIKREGYGLRATFILRNVIDHQGVEVLYEMYDPAVIKIEVLKLEKRLDDELLYLRDALPEYSTFDPNMEIEILPEGSILAVTISDPHTMGKTNRFVGICIKREGYGLRATFILRNVIDHQGVEVLYEMYDPALIKIEVLKLEKRLDDELLYLRDALPEYSTFDPNMEIEILPEGNSESLCNYIDF
ncbi:hypothetical protein FQA39_LY19076 [Lamprigera yunnana]|nr:hypothetical protein FQA39_LY19076 [Lamprigera yunnana]